MDSKGRRPLPSDGPAVKDRKHEKCLLGTLQIAAV